MMNALHLSPSARVRARFTFDVRSRRCVGGRTKVLRAVFATLSIGAGLLWSAFACFVLALHQVNGPMPWLAVACTSGVAGGLTNLLAPRPWLLRASLLAFELPMFVLLVVLGSAASLTLAPFVLVQLGFQLVAGGKMYDGYIASLYANARLRAQERKSSLLAAAVGGNDYARDAHRESERDARFVTTTSKTVHGSRGQAKSVRKRSCVRRA